MDSIAHNRLELGRDWRARRPDAAPGKASNRCFIIGPAAKTRSIWLHLRHRSRKPRMQRRRFGAELEHIAENGDAAAATPRIGKAPSERQRRPHRTPDWHCSFRRSR